MRNEVTIYMKSGVRHSVAGYTSQVAEKINVARGSGQLLALEKPTIPTGQMFYIDPVEVESVR